jgi:hypothetical protein
LFFGTGPEWPSAAISKIRKAVFGGNPPGETFDIRVREAGEDAEPPEAAAAPAQTYGPEDRTPGELVSIIDQDSTPVLIRAAGGGGKSSFLFEAAIELEEAGIDFIWPGSTSSGWISSG